MDDWSYQDFESFEPYSDVSGTYVPEPAPTSVNLPTPQSTGGFWENFGNLFKGVASATQSVSSVIQATRGTPASNVARASGTLTQQQLDALRAKEKSQAATGATLSKYLPWGLLLIGLGIFAWAVSRGRRKG